MRFPWVSRERLTADADHWQRLYDNAMERAEMWHDAYDSLMEKYHALRVSGANQSDPPPALEPREFDPIADAITRKAGPNLSLRGIMGRRAAQEKAAGVPIMTIVERIEAGQTDDAGPQY